MNWFERITGFAETDYASTQARLVVDGTSLVSQVTGRRFGIGRLSLPSLSALRQDTLGAGSGGRRSTLRCLAGDVRALHQRPEHAGALFQVASQFNLLEMVSPEVAPEAGVTRYAHDATQGPACAMAAGAATIFRNYRVPIEADDAGPAQLGQTATRQIDTLRPLGQQLARATGRPLASLWTMRNGYALCNADGLAALGGLLQSASAQTLDEWRGHLQIGLHQDVDVTDFPGPQRPRVSQAFCSALPVAYSGLPAADWAPMARLVLEAAYEATLRAALRAHMAGGSPQVLLTRLGGGAFGNDDDWIDDAILRAMACVEQGGLDVWLVSWGRVHPRHERLVKLWGARGLSPAVRPG